MLTKPEILATNCMRSSLTKEKDFCFKCHHPTDFGQFSFRILETTSNAASSVHSKKSSKNKHQAEAEKQKVEAEAKAAKDREEVGSFCYVCHVCHAICVEESVTNTVVKCWVTNIV